MPCASSSPSEGEPGGRPKPRKSSEVSVVIEPTRMNGRKVSVATMAFGSRCRNMMVRVGDAERARGVDIFEIARRAGIRRAPAPTSDTQENSSRMPSSTKKPGTSTEEMISSR